MGFPSEDLTEYCFRRAMLGIGIWGVSVPPFVVVVVGARWWCYCWYIYISSVVLRQRNVWTPGKPKPFSTVAPDELLSSKVRQLLK